MSYGLNLLPPNEKSTVALETARHQWTSVFASIVATLVLLIAGVLFLTTRLDQRLTTLTDEEQSLQRQASGAGTIDLTRDTNHVNNQIASLRTVLGIDRDWASIIRLIMSELPSNVSLTTIKIYMGGSVTLSGTAASRSAFLGLQSALEKSKVLRNAQTADTPSKRDNLPFTYTATLASNP